MTERTTAVEQVTSAQLASRVRSALTRLSRRIRQARPVGDLTMTQLSALTSLQLAGALTPRELADTERVRPPTMTRIIAKLEERGLVGRSPHPTDGRQVILAPTPGAEEVLDRFQRARDNWLAERLAELTAAERETLRDAAEILHRVVDADRR